MLCKAQAEPRTSHHGDIGQRRRRNPVLRNQLCRCSFGICFLHSLKKEQKQASKRDNVGRQEEQKAVEVIKNILCGKALKGFEVQSTPAKEWQMKEAEVHQTFSNGKLMVVVYYLKTPPRKLNPYLPLRCAILGM